MQYLCDYHTHSNNSMDGRDTVMEMCRSAAVMGFSEIVLTDHFEPVDGNGKCKYYKPDLYLNDIKDARDKLCNKIKIKMGVELGQPHLFSESSEQILNSLPYDYVIGSVHKLADGSDLYELDYRNIKLDDICKMYLKELTELAAWGKFDCLGHLDLIKRYASSTYNTRITLFSQYEMLKEVFKVIIPKGKGIEINTSGLRQSPKETMPGIDVIKLYRSMGGEVLTIGSDAHTAQDVGKGVITALDLALEAGFKHITVFDERKPSWKKISVNPAVYSIPAESNIA